MSELEVYTNSQIDCFNYYMNKAGFGYSRQEMIDVVITNSVFNYCSNFNYELCPYNFYNKIIFNQMSAAIDQRYSSVIIDTFFINEIGRKVLSDRCNKYIFTTFHYSSYRLLPVLLFKEKVDVCLVITTDVLNKQGDEFIKVRDSVDKNVRFKLLDAESRNIVKECLKALKNGYNLLFYIDGNAGVGGMNRRDESLSEIDFIDKKLLTRQGISFLSYASSTPIVPVVTNRISFDQVEFDFYDPLDIPDRSIGSMVNTTRSIYSILERYLQVDPSKWEAWLYLYKWIVSSDAVLRKIVFDENVCTLKFNETDFGLIDYGVAKALLNKKSMKIFKITEAEYSLLNKIVQTKLLKELSSDELDLVKSSDFIGFSIETNVI